jgi:tetratricopeptide (TPR) repeat protein
MFLTKQIRRGLFLAVTLLAGAQSVVSQGLPGENLLTQRWRDFIANHSPVTNAALITEENYASGRIAFSPILKGQFKHTELGITIPIGLYQSAGLTYIGEFDGNLPGSPSFDGNRLVAGSDDGTSNSNVYLAGTYAYNFWSRFSLGVNLVYARQSNFGSPRQGLGLDFGLTFRALRHSILGDHVFGISTQNLIAPQMTEGISFKFDTQGSYARNLKLLKVSNYFENRIQTALDLNFKDFIVNAKEFQSDPKGDLYLNYKIGVWLLKLIKINVHTGLSADGLDYWGLAMGMNVPGMNNGRDLEFLYQYDMMTQDESEATGHTVYARVNVGKHREEIWARKMARMASLSPNDLYNKARKLYADKKYWDAFFLFSRLSTEFPDFFKIDWVEHYRGSCLEELDMREAAIKNYEKVKSSFPLSSATPHSDLGLMRVVYRKGDFNRVATQFNELSKPNVPDSLRYHATYLMGQAFLQQNNQAKAMDAFSKIPDGHPDYVFAQHGIAVAQAQAGAELSNVVATLENCAGAKVNSEAEKEIINRTYLFLGYIFYEENTLSKAIVSLRMVPQSSVYAEDALLGQGWTSLKARQWTDCVSVGQMLQKTTDKDILKCEGMLIESYGHLLLKNYIQAMKVLQEAVDKVKKLKNPDQDSLNYSRMQNESERMAYNNLAENIEYIAGAGQTVTIQNQIDSLHVQQLAFVDKFKQFYKFENDFKRTSFFSRNLQTVTDDIEYAYATVQKIVGQKGLLKEQEKLGDKQKSIDNEIEKLKSEMEKLQKSK